MRIKNGIVIHKISALVLTILIGLVVFMACPRPLVGSSQAHRTNGGVALGMFASQPDYNYQGLLKEIRLHHGDRLLLVVPYYLQTIDDHLMVLEPGLSPSIDNIERTLKQAQRFGFEISVVPILRIKKRKPGEWRGRLQPKAGIKVFFKNYLQAIRPLVRMANHLRCALSWAASSFPLSMSAHTGLHSLKKYGSLSMG